MCRSIQGHGIKRKLLNREITGYGLVMTEREKLCNLLLFNPKTGLVSLGMFDSFQRKK
jgi:hypothetical protein